MAKLDKVEEGAKVVQGEREGGALHAFALGPLLGVFGAL